MKNMRFLFSTLYIMLQELALLKFATDDC